MDILYSIITGVISGLIVAVSFWFIQLQVEKNRIRHEVSRDLSLFLGRLSDSFSQPNTYNIHSAVNMLASVASVINQIIASSPIDYWQSHIIDKNYRAIMNEIISFRNQYKTTKIAAQNLDIVLWQKIRLKNASENLISANDEADHAFFLGKVDGMSTEEIMPFLESGGPGRLEPSYEYLKRDKEIATCANKYKSEREKLKAAISNLENQLLLFQESVAS